MQTERSRSGMSPGPAASGQCLDTSGERALPARPPASDAPPSAGHTFFNSGGCHEKNTVCITGSFHENSTQKVVGLKGRKEGRRVQAFSLSFAGSL